jgi:hypothetical protein
MADDASEFLDAWFLTREDKSPLSRSEAEAIAVEWMDDATANGIDPVDLDRAAGGDLPAYLLRVFGEASAADFSAPAS